MIINTGARTDIPAFYSKWLINRIKEGFVLVRNPYNSRQISRYLLDPSLVDCLAFCTKNPQPMLKYMDEIKQYKQYWFVSITPYGEDIEENVPAVDTVIESFKQLSKIVGINCLGWRYDPILITDRYSVEKHIQEFEAMCEKLQGYVRDVTISFIDLYRKLQKNCPELKAPSRQQEDEIAEAFARIASEHEMVIHGCCERKELQKFGIDTAGCMSRQIVERALGHKLNPNNLNRPRPFCDCLMGHDIGAYSSCLHLCRYCYANAGRNTVIENHRSHDENSPLLLGNLMPDDKITAARQSSWRSGFEQIALF